MKREKWGRGNMEFQVVGKKTMYGDLLAVISLFHPLSFTGTPKTTFPQSSHDDTILAPKASSLSFTVGVVDTHGTTRLSCFFLSELKPKQTNVVCVRFFFLAFFPGDVTAPLL